MRRLPCLAVSLLAVSLLVGVAAAQDRRAHPGRVLDAGGKPVAGAEVTLLFAPPFGAELGCSDVVRCRSDAEGRFRAELLTGAGYVAWAATEAHQSGVVDVDPARQCELRLDSEPRLRQYRIDGLDAWADAGPFTLHVEIAGVPGLCPDLRMAAGKVELPLLPADRMDGVLLDKNGVAVWPIRGFDTGDGEAVPPPRTIPARVVDDAGRPVAGAVLQQVWSTSVKDELGRFAARTRLVRRAVTDAEGRAQVRVACAKDPFEAGNESLDIHFLASKDGCDGSICGFFDALYLDGKKADAEQQARKQFEFVLRKATPFAGRATGSPATLPHSLVVRATARAAVDTNGWSELPFAVCVPVDREGRFGLPPLPAGAQLLDVLVAPPPPALAADDPFRRSCARSPAAFPIRADADKREISLDLALLDAYDRLGRERFCEVRYEELVAAPVDTTAAMLRDLGLADDADVLAHAAALDRNVTQTAVTAPRPEKWRDENPAAIESILPQIAPVMSRLGYSLD